MSLKSTIRILMERIGIGRRPLALRCLIPRVRNPQNTYDDFKNRKDELARLGFATYTDYLKSPLWANIKAKHYAMPGNRSCFCCGSTTQLHVHHIRYAEMDTTKNLKSLCARCHESVHEKTSKHPKSTSIRRATLNVRKIYSKPRTKAKAILGATGNPPNKVIPEKQRADRNRKKAKVERLVALSPRSVGKLQKSMGKNTAQLRRR